MKLEDFGKLAEGDVYGRDFLRSVRLGMSPFRPATVAVYYQFDFDANSYSVIVDARLMSGRLITHKESMDASGLAGSPDQTIYKVCRSLIQKFRQREIEPEENIILGVE